MSHDAIIPIYAERVDGLEADAALITRTARKQTYYTIRFLADNYAANFESIDQRLTLPDNPSPSRPLSRPARPGHADGDCPRRLSGRRPGLDGSANTGAGSGI